MVKKLMLAVAAVALLAAPAFAAVQNVKVSGDLKTTSVIRSSFDLGASAANGGTVAETAQNVILSQVGLNVAADLTDNVSTMIRVGNERLWGTNAGADVNQVNLDTAYVSMKEFLYSPLTLTIGRQQLAYGNQFLIGDWGHYSEVVGVTDLTGGVNFDAIKAVLSYDPLTIDLFASKVIERNITAATAHTNNDTNLYGINANYKFGDKMSTILEGYTFILSDRSQINGGADTKGNTIYAPGLRVSTNPIEGLNVQLEGTYEFGTAGQSSATEGKVNLSAYGFQGKLNYALPVLKEQKPVVSAGWTYLSGGKTGDPDNKDRWFESLYRNQYVGRIFSSTMNASSNIVIGELAFEITPIKDLTTKLTWYNLSMTHKLQGPDTDTITLADGNSVTFNTTGSKGLGNELDLDLSYAYTEDVKFGVSAGWFDPGKALDKSNRDSASQLLSSVSVAF